MRYLATFFRFLGYLWLAVAVAVIIVGTVRVGIKSGISAAMNLLSPFNIWNFFTMLITLAPGFGLLFLSDKLKRKIRRRENVRNP